MHFPCVRGTFAPGHDNTNYPAMIVLDAYYP
jgi:hypothetical protein